LSSVSLVSRTARIVLLAALAFPRCHGRHWVKTRQVYAEYTRLSAIANAKPVTYRQFTTIIKQLEEVGVIERAVWSVGRYGKESVMKVRDPDRVWGELSEDLALGELTERLCAQVNTIPYIKDSMGFGATLIMSDAVSDSTVIAQVSKAGTV
jgi:hypothetical protein